MRPVIGAAALGALALGGAIVLATSRHSPDAQAQPQASAAIPAPTTAAPVNALNDSASQPVVTPAVATSQTTTIATPAAQRVVYRTTTTTTSRHRVVRHTQSAKKSGLIIGGSAAGGALVGSLVGGGKGALVGGLVGGAAGTVYDRKTRHHVRRE